MAKMTLDELRKMRDNTKTDIKRREIEGKEIQIIVGMGTCGIASGAKVTMDAFLKELGETNMADKVIIRQTGCMGLCHSEPTVKIIAPGMPEIIYGRVDAVLAKDLVKKHIIGKELIDDHILNEPSGDIMSIK